MRKSGLRCSGLGLVLLLLCLTLPSRALACVVGSGTGASCTESALDVCLPGGGSFDGTVTFDCSGAATITVTSTKTISADTTIDGGSLITISGGNSVGVFSVNAGATFTIKNLTIANGHSATFGGAIFNGNSGGTLTVSNSAFSGNGALDGGGIFNYSGTFTVSNSTFSGNSAIAGGGGIYNNSGTLTVIDSTFSGNSAISYGGGMSNTSLDSSATLTVTSSTFSGNRAGDGGGIQNFGMGTVTNSTFFGNSASHDGGGIENGITNGKGDTLTITSSTFSGNGAGDGSGIANFGTVAVTNAIVANSTSGGNCAGSTTDGGHNIDDGTTCGFSTANGSLNNTNPNLDPAGLANNGGPTQTIALCTGTGVPSAGCAGASPAINAGDESVCSTTTGTAPVDNLDQRGFVRPGTGATNCSIGAFEANFVGPITPKLVYYALGDSIASGHGLPGGTGRTPGTCQVSPNAYPSFVFQLLQTYLPQYSSSFVPLACSGAKSFTTSQRTAPLTDLPQQVAAVLQNEPFPPGQTTLVSLTVGADDFDFQAEVENPLHICASDDQFMQWVNDTIGGPSNNPSQGVHPSLTHWLKMLLEDDHTFVVLTDYFNPFNTASHYFKILREEELVGRGASLAFPDDVLWERTDRVINNLNVAIASVAQQSGSRVLVASLHDTFVNHESAMPDCGDSPPDASTTLIQYPSFSLRSALDEVELLIASCIDPITCPLTLLEAAGLIDSLLNQLQVGDDCFHPNAEGAAAYAGGAGLGPGVFDAALELLPPVATSSTSGVAPEMAHVGFRPLLTTAVGMSEVSSAPCCTTHTDPGCNDASCQSCVCAVDGFCCTVGWDVFCTNEGATTCESACQCPEPSPTNTPGPTPTPGGACCASHGGAGCDDATCVTCVCALDSDCCSNAWDDLCTAQAQMQCAASCLCPTPVPADTSTPTGTATPSATGTPPAPTPSPTSGGDCCTLHAGPNCGDSTCAACVCAADTFCCDTLWDQSCADEAVGACDRDCACATPTNTPGLMPTATTTATPTVTPTGAPAATEIPTLTAMPSPTSTPEPTGTPLPTATVAATATPSATPSLTQLPTAPPTVTALPCVGDCDGNGQVTVDEILTMVNIALGSTPVTACDAGDANHDGQITIDEILTAVNNALNGCGSASTPTPNTTGADD